MGCEAILYAKHEQVAALPLSRPERLNAISPTLGAARRPGVARGLHRDAQSQIYRRLRP